MTLSRAIICDIDGVIADHSHRFHHIKKKCRTNFCRTEMINGMVAEYGCAECENKYPRNWKPDYEKFYETMSEDNVNDSLQFLLQQNAYAQGSERYHPEYTVIFVTGRPERFREVTKMWIDQKVSLHYYELFMRPDYLRDDEMCRTGKGSDCDSWKKQDYRPAYEVKRNIYENHIKGKYDVLFAIDDSETVCQMWKGLGIMTLMVV